MASMGNTDSSAIEEYDGVELPHIARIMDSVSDICPPLFYPHTGPRAEPRQPHLAGRWQLGSYTGPGAERQAERTNEGKYYVGASWPSTMLAPQSVLWTPPKFPDCTYIGSPDRIGHSRREDDVPLDVIRPGPAYPQEGLTSESSQADKPYARTGCILLPWTVLVWGNSWADTYLLGHWIASKAHDLERSQPERVGERFTARAAGWTEDRPGDRGVVWQMIVVISAPIVRSEYDRTKPTQARGTRTWETPPGAEVPMEEGEPGP